MRPKNGPSMSNSGIVTIGLPDFRSFRRKRVIHKSDNVIWSSSGERPFQGKYPKKKLVVVKNPRSQTGKSRKRRKLTRAEKKTARIRELRLQKREKKSQILVKKRAQRLDRLLKQIKQTKKRNKPRPLRGHVEETWSEKYGIDKLEFIRSFLGRR